MILEAEERLQGPEKESTDGEERVTGRKEGRQDEAAADPFPWC